MARAAAAAAAGTVQFGCPRAERGRGAEQTWQDIDLNPQIVCSNKLFQVRCHFPFALPPLLPLLPLFCLPPPLLPLPALGSSLATPCTCPAPFRNGRHVRAQLLFILTICCAQERCTTVPPLHTSPSPFHHPTPAAFTAPLPDCPTLEIFSLLFFSSWSRARPRG